MIVAWLRRALLQRHLVPERFQPLDCSASDGGPRASVEVGGAEVLVLGLSWPDVDRERGTVTVRRQL